MPRCFPFNEDGCFVPALIQIHDLPPDCWSQKVLSMIGSEVGKPLYTDNLTRTRERLEYARPMVEVLVVRERVSEVPITLPTGVHIDLRIIYEMVPDLCEVCKKIGHRKDTCRGGVASGGQQHDRADRTPPADMNGQQPGRSRSQSARGRRRERDRNRTRQQ